MLSRLAGHQPVAHGPGAGKHRRQNSSGQFVAHGLLGWKIAGCRVEGKLCSPTESHRLMFAQWAGTALGSVGRSSRQLRSRDVVLLVAWARVINPAWVGQQGDTYAERLFEALGPAAYCRSRRPRLRNMTSAFLSVRNTVLGAR